MQASADGGEPAPADTTPADLPSEGRGAVTASPTPGSADAPEAGAPRQVVAPDSARLDSLTARLASQLRCPVCRNQSVLESSATLSREMQEVIRERLARGESPDEVKAYFVDKYGSWILLRPEAEGIGLLVYLLPAVALLAGGYLVWHLIRRWSSAGTGDELSPELSGTGGEFSGLEGEASPQDAGPRRAAAGSGPAPDPAAYLPDDLSPEERAWLRRQLRETEAR